MWLCRTGSDRWKQMNCTLWVYQPQLSQPGAIPLAAVTANCFSRYKYLLAAICDVGLYYSCASVFVTNLHLQFHARQPKTSIAIAACLQRPPSRQKHKQKQHRRHGRARGTHTGEEAHRCHCGGRAPSERKQEKKKIWKRQKPKLMHEYFIFSAVM